MKRPLLSLCLPTNGISEWVFPVLDSIFSQEIDNSLYEVVVTDNGNNQDFFEKMLYYATLHSNLIYKKTNAYLFENQIEALRLANGDFLKFLNHRAVLEPDSLKWMIEFVEKYREEKPVIYLSNGQLELNENYETNSFDGFVRGIREFASWTTGVGVWKTDFEKIPDDKVYNKISPHSDVLFAERKKDKYVINDYLWCHEIDKSHKKKGSYDLYKAFGIEEFSITLGLYLDGDITVETLKAVKKAYEKLLVRFYMIFSILKHPCSYNLKNFNKSTSIFFSPTKIKFKAWFGIIPAGIRKIFRMIKK